MKISRFIAFLAVFIFLASCENEKKDVIEMSDIIPQAEGKYNGKDSVDQVKNDSLKKFKEALDICSFSFDRFINLEDKLFPDRFEPIRMIKLGLINDKDTTKYFKWTYKDSVHTMNAFYNWLDRFGKNKNPIIVAEERNFQRKAFQLFVGDTNLIFIQGDTKVDFKNWSNCQDSMGYKSDWNYLIEQSAGGKAKWYTFTEEKKTKIENRP